VSAKSERSQVLEVTKICQTSSKHYALWIRESIFVSLSWCCGSKTSLNLELNLQTINTCHLVERQSTKSYEHVKHVHKVSKRACI